MNRNEKLDDKLLTCSLTLFGKGGLDLFIEAEEISGYLSKNAYITSLEFKLLSRDRSVLSIDFYTVENRYELSSRLKELFPKYSYGLSYRIKVIKDP